MFFGMMGAMALSFNACSSDDALVDNPNYDKETNTVNANFVFNVATNNSSTRMTAANTQADIAQNFRGIDNAQLFAYKLGTANDGKTVATATTAAKTYGLGKVLAAGELDPDGGADAVKSRRVLELSLPVETNALLFWGKAIKSGTDNQQGKVSFDPSNADISQHRFGLTPRVAEGSAGDTMMKHYQDLISKLLNKVVQTVFQKEAGEVTWGTAIGGDGTTTLFRSAAIDIAWSDFVNVAADGKMTPKTTAPLNASLPMCALGEILADAFINFNTIYENEARAGSGASVHKMISDLYAVINKVAEASPVSYQEYVAQQIAIEIRKNIRLISSDGTALNAISTLKTNAGVNYTDVENSIEDFPDAIEAIGLPKGAAQLTNTIAQARPVVTWSYTLNVHSGVSGVTHSVYKYTYPAEICYFGNSPMRVSNTPHATTEYPDGAGADQGEWMNNDSWTTDWSAIGKHVLSTTRSAAMAHNINYGSALLKSSVAFANGVTELQDNNATIQHDRTGATEENNKFNAVSGQFTLTGILVGGQTPTVGWNYIPVANTFDNVVYDKDIVAAAVPTPANQENYTLVWDNYNSSLAANQQQDVLVALEFTNGTGKDFWGEKNLVRNGGTFYLLGKLSPTATGLTAITWPTLNGSTTDYALPPYDADGKTIQAPRVFIQDYVTEAKFIIGETSLQHAYVTVPDLRSTQISLGLSVDLQWRTGLSFENVVLGE